MSSFSQHILRSQRGLCHRWTVAFITRTYALYDRSRAVLVGLVSLALAGIALGGVSRDP